MLDFHNLIYFKDDSSLYVNLYVPSEVTWERPDGPATLTQDTMYPQANTITMRLGMKRSTNFSPKFRVPGWARNVSVKVNGAAADVTCTPGTWATVTRTWNDRDRVSSKVRPYYSMEENYPYKMYFDAKGLPFVLV